MEMLVKCRSAGYKTIFNHCCNMQQILGLSYTGVTLLDLGTNRLKCLSHAK
jgi:hypothetical protein